MSKNNDNQDNKKIKHKKHIIIILTLFIIIISLISAIFIKIIYPQNCIISINDNYSLQQYIEVSKYDSKLNIIKDFLNPNDDEYKEIQYKVKISNAIISFENKQYDIALSELEQIELIDENVKAKINDCKYELTKKYINEKQYNNALKFIEQVNNKEDISDLKDTIHYNLALEYLQDKKYKNALDEIVEVKNKDYDNLQNTKSKIHYEYGKFFLGKKDYNGGISQLEQAGDYEDAKTLVINAYIEQAEKYIKAEKFDEAKNIYNFLSEDAEYNGVKVSVRRYQLSKFSGLIDATGKKYATKSYCDVKNVWKYDGRWDKWYYDTTNNSEYINTSLKLNNDGTITLNGSVYFYAFNNFSSLAEYCTAKIISKTIKIENISSIPSTYNLDDDTKLLYSKGKFSIKYSKRDDYSINFYNLYTSSVTY